MQERADIIRRVWEELEAELAEQGYELVEVEFEPRGRRSILRLYIDRTGGVTLDQCTAASQFLSPLLDVKNILEGGYVLEVSSPGIDRPLRKPADFLRFVGERAKVQVRVPVDGRHRFTGVLKGFRDGLVQFECEGSSYEIHIGNLKKANLDR